MRKLSIVFGLIILVLIFLYLAPDATLIRYVSPLKSAFPEATVVISHINAVRAALPEAILVTAIFLFLAIVLNYLKAKSVQPAKETEMALIVPPTNEADEDLNSLAAKFELSLNQSTNFGPTIDEAKIEHSVTEVEKARIAPDVNQAERGLNCLATQFEQGLNPSTNFGPTIDGAKLLPTEGKARTAFQANQANAELTSLEEGIVEPASDSCAKIGAATRVEDKECKTFSKDCQFSLGIDLGTNKIAIAISEIDNDQANIVEVTQLLQPYLVGEKPTLPFMLYTPPPDEFPRAALSLPWRAADGAPIIGVLARDQGALVPDRLITSVMSWLSNPYIDARQPFLPLRSDIGEERLSPFECLRNCLEHIRESCLYATWSQGKYFNLEGAQVVLTVPTYFDEIARSLTAEAAFAAGLGKVVLLEESFAAFYAWIAQAGNSWRAQVQPGDIVLVCDVGGESTEFSLIGISEKEGCLDLKRLNMAEHILLGGDNMDLALAHALRARLESEGKSISELQFRSLRRSANKVKDAMFQDESITELPITIPDLVSTKLNRQTLEQVILDGFFPINGIENTPEKIRRASLQEFGLPYATDPLISRHLARFLMRSLGNLHSGETPNRIGNEGDSRRPLLPTAVLFNGGVFKGAPIRRRILELLAAWNEGRPVKELSVHETDLAVARGASFFGRNRIKGKQIRLKATASYSYYIGFDASMPAVPGIKQPIKSLCVVPQGMEEGAEVPIEGRDFFLLTGEPTEFRLFSSRRDDTPGQIIPNAEHELREMMRFEVDLPTVENDPAGQLIPVKINAVLAEFGILDLWIKHIKSDRRWKFRFVVKME